MRVISLVEKGWGGARRLSIQLAGRGVTVSHYVRGCLSRELLGVVTPYAGMTIRGFDPRWYKTIVWFILLSTQGQREALMVLVDNERTFSWVKRFFPRLQDALVLVHELPDGSPQVIRSGTGVDPAALRPDVS